MNINMDDATEICNAVSRYCRGVDDRDFHELELALADDVVFDMGEHTTHNRAELFEFMSHNMWPPGKHVYVTPIVSVDGDTALFLSDWFWLDPDKAIGHTGRYSIDLRRDGQAWVISELRLLAN
jgi:hypothetical protein